MAVNSFREDEHIQATDAKKIVNRLLGYLKGYTKEVILVLVAMTITVGISLYNPLLIETAIDDYSPGCLCGGRQHPVCNHGENPYICNVLYIQ